jgi:hypothetical protein
VLNFKIEILEDLQRPLHRKHCRSCRSPWCRQDDLLSPFSGTSGVYTCGTPCRNQHRTFFGCRARGFISKEASKLPLGLNPIMNSGSKAGGHPYMTSSTYLHPLTTSARLASHITVKPLTLVVLTSVVTLAIR